MLNLVALQHHLNDIQELQDFIRSLSTEVFVMYSMPYRHTIISRLEDAVAPLYHLLEDTQLKEDQYED